MKRSMIAAILFFGITAPLWGAQSDTVVIAKAPVDVKRRTFDPRQPPAEMPKLVGQEAAVTSSQYGVETGLSMTLQEPTDGGPAEVTITQVKAKLTLAVTVWLPLRAWKELKEHEEAHREIYEFYYEDADKVATKLAEDYVGLKFKGRDTKAAQTAAMKKAEEFSARYMKAVQEPASRVNELFDEISDHGRRKNLTAEQGMKAAFKKYEAESARRQSADGRNRRTDE